MLRKCFVLGLAAMLVALATSSTALAWGCCHAGYHYGGYGGGGYHAGYTHYSPYSGLQHYGTTGTYGGARYGSYGAYGGYHYGGYAYGTGTTVNGYHVGWR